MNIKRLLFASAQKIFDAYEMRAAKNFEINKFKDPRRMAICREGRLSDIQKREVDAFYLSHYGEKIPYTWHEHNKAITGVFDVRFFPELLYIPEFERFANLNESYIEAFQDKNMLHALALKANVRMPKSIIESSYGVLSNGEGVSLTWDDACSAVASYGNAFIKPTRGTSSGKGCRVVDFVEGIDVLSGESVHDILASMGSDFTVQEVVHCRGDIAALHQASVNTFRVMTYRWKDDLIAAPPIIRIGRGGSHLDNAHAGGLFVGVTKDGRLCKKAITEFNDEYYSHPDSGIAFEGYQIEKFQDVIDAALRLHECIPALGIVSWDLTVDEFDKPVLIEANLSGGSIWLIQLAHGVPIFGDRTAEILEWIRLVKSCNISDRNKHLFGR